MTYRLRTAVAIGSAALLAGAASPALGVGVREYAPIPSPNTGAGEFGARPHDILAAAGSIWFTEYRDGQLGRLDPASGALTEINLLPAIPGRSSRPEPRELALQPGTNTIWWSEFSAGRVSFLDAAAPAAGITSVDVGDVGPNGLEFTSDGALWIGLRKTNQIMKYVPSTGAKTIYTLTTDPTILGLEGVAFQGGKIWVAAVDDNAVYSLDLSKANPASPGSGVNRYPIGSPVSLAVDPSGRVWTGAIAFQYLVRLTPSNLIDGDPSAGIDGFRVAGVYPHDVEAISDGSIWFADYGSELLLDKTSKGGNSLGRFVPATGQIERYVLPAGAVPDPKVQRLALDANGDVWFTETKANRVGVLDIGNANVPGTTPLLPGGGTAPPTAVPTPAGVAKLSVTLSAKRLRGARVRFTGKARPVGSVRAGRSVKLEIKKRVTVRRRVNGRLRITHPFRFVAVRRANLNRRTGAFTFTVVQPNAARYRVTALARRPLTSGVSKPVQIKAV